MKITSLSVRRDGKFRGRPRITAVGPGYIRAMCIGHLHGVIRAGSATRGVIYNASYSWPNYKTSLTAESELFVVKVFLFLVQTAIERRLYKCIIRLTAHKPRFYHATTWIWGNEAMKGGGRLFDYCACAVGFKRDRVSDTAY